MREVTGPEPLSNDDLSNAVVHQLAQLHITARSVEGSNRLWQLSAPGLDGSPHCRGANDRSPAGHREPNRLSLAVIVARRPVDALTDEAFRTQDPLGAFVREEYALGNDYFAHGNQDTYILRCLLRRGPNLFDGVALSEISISERTGPWKIFRAVGRSEKSPINRRG